ncbi:hypothetical protein EXIGLDRAFT_771069 [Exidia glandulosa HHB12029]|uniref:Uncharacterized protein n=1 Tax=Exidia glandulosa HHB12029 TaxID=1314781 RepID=A0A166AAK4_EXIGL|nr:hypothetical protein EXIGLDRAFT_771069 [Exidia glandulosa HHB12029]
MMMFANPIVVDLRAKMNAKQKLILEMREELDKVIRIHEQGASRSESLRRRRQMPWSLELTVKLREKYAEMDRLLVENADLQMRLARDERLKGKWKPETAGRTINTVLSAELERKREEGRKKVLTSRDAEVLRHAESLQLK